MADPRLSSDVKLSDDERRDINSFLDNIESVPAKGLVNTLGKHPNFKNLLALSILPLTFADLFDRAARNTDASIVKFMWEVAITAPSSRKLTLILKDSINSSINVSTQNTNYDVFEFLFSKRADDFDYDYLFYRAIRENREKIFFLVVKDFLHQLDLLDTDLQAHSTPLRTCILARREVFFISLFSALQPYDVNAGEREPLLHLAVMHKKTRFVSLLIFFGADTTVVYNGKTAADLAQTKGYSDFSNDIQEVHCQRLAFNIIKKRAADIVIALQTADIDVVRLIEIIRNDGEIGYVAKNLPDHWLWKIITAIKYFETPTNAVLYPINRVDFKIRQLIERADTADLAFAAIAGATLRKANANEEALIKQKFG